MEYAVRTHPVCPPAYPPARPLIHNYTHPPTAQRSTWEDIRARLSPGVEGCRLIVNLGAAPPSVPGQPWQPDAYTTLRAYEALEAAFGGVCGGGEGALCVCV